MTLPVLLTGELDSYRGRFITVTEGLSGYFAVMYWWNPEGFWEPWETGFGRYEHLWQAREEARQWAADNGLPVTLEVMK